jgi:hypothetical protein
MRPPPALLSAASRLLLPPAASTGISLSSLTFASFSSTASSSHAESSNRQQQHPHSSRRLDELGLTDDQMEFKRVAEAFARENLAPHSASWDADHHFLVDTLRSAAVLGFGGMYVAV